MIVPSSYKSELKKEHGYAFFVGAPISDEGKAAAEYAYKNLKAKNAAIIGISGSDTSYLLANAFKERFEQLGGAVKIAFYEDPYIQDFTSQLTIIRGSDSGFIYAPITTAGIYILSINASQMGVKIPIVYGMSDPSKVTLLAPTQKNVYTSQYHSVLAKTTFSSKYLELYNEKNLEYVNQNSALGADAYFMITDAMQRAVSTKPSSIAEALRRTKGFEGITGTLSFTKDGQTLKNISILEIKEGKPEPITTIHFVEPLPGIGLPTSKVFPGEKENMTGPAEKVPSSERKINVPAERIQQPSERILTPPKIIQPK
jgi:branched-chain amino acid transport system substrate-binding protein